MERRKNKEEAGEGCNISSFYLYAKGKFHSGICPNNWSQCYEGMVTNLMKYGENRKRWKVM